MPKSESNEASWKDLGPTMAPPPPRNGRKRGNLAPTVRGIIIGIGLSYVMSFLAGGSFAFSKSVSFHGSSGIGSSIGRIGISRSLKEEEIHMSKQHENEEEEEKEEIDDELEAASIVCIIILLIVMTIAFEAIEELIEESSPRDMKPIVASLFSEMTILGFLSVCTFGITRTPFPYKLSEKLFGEEEFLVEIFEMVHFCLFFIMIFFVAQVLVLLKDSIKTENKWLVLDRVCQQLRHAGESQGSRTEPNLDLFMGLRDEFVLERSVEPPFEPTPEEHRVPKDFNFGRYLSICMGITVSDVVHVNILSWVAFIILTLAFYFVMLAFDNNLVVIAWIWAGLGWFSFVFLVLVFERYLKTIAKALAAPSHGEKTQASAGEQDGLLFSTTNSAVLPAWCKIDMDRYMSKRSWLKRCICRKTPNRQDTLFWFETKGPHLHLLILQINLVLMGVYGALLVLAFFPAIFAECSSAVLVAYLVVALLPVLGIMLRIRYVVGIMSVVGSIGSQRRPQVISDVIRQEKTQLVVRAFLVLEKMHRLAMQEDGDEHDSASSENRELTHLETVEVGATFDAFDRSGDGQICISELDRVMQNLGGASPEKLQKILLSLDVNGDGQVSKAEFLEWYRCHMVEEKQKSLHERAHALFHMFDENDSGEISIGEFKRTLDAFDIGFTVDEVGQIVNELDEDGNIMIGFEEFHELLEKYYPSELEEE